MGLGGALLNNPADAVIGHFFNRRRGLATGLAATAGSIGGIVFPLILQATLPRLGYPWSMRILGFILLALAVPANLLVRTPLPPPEETASMWPNFRLFLDPRLACCCGGIFFKEYGVLIRLTYVVSYAADHGLDPGESYILLALLNAGSVLGRAGPGLLADKWGRFNMIILTVGMCAVSILALWLPAGGSKALLVVFTVVLGFASGGNVSLLPVCVGQLCDSRDYGRFLSSAMLVASFGTLTGIPIGGALLRLPGDGVDCFDLIFCPLLCGFSWILHLCQSSGCRLTSQNNLLNSSAFSIINKMSSEAYSSLLSCSRASH